MNRKVMILLISGIILAVALVLVILLPGVSKNEEAQEEPQSSVSLRTSQSESASEAEPETVSDREPTENSEEAASAPQQTAGETLMKQPEESYSEAASAEAAETVGEAPYTKPEITECTAEQAADSEKIVFPYAIPGTDLVVDSVNSYDGLFLEDGSDAEIAGIAAVILRNTGSQCIDYAEVTMKGSQADYLFIFSHLESHSAIVVQEAGRAPCVSQEYDCITAEPACSDGFEMSENQLEIRETSDNQLQVKNLTDEVIPCVRIFYKFYLEEEEVYVGGITYVAKVMDLKPGAVVHVAPSHYAAGSSRVVMVRTFEADGK